MLYRLFLLLVLSFTLSSCSSKGKTYTVGVDPSWFPLNLMGKEPNVYAFSNELLHEISKLEGINFESVKRNWDNLSLGLEEKKYDAILSSIYPYVFETKKYDFSEPYLNTGPVLVMRADMKLGKRDGLAGKEIAVPSKQMEALLIKQYPQTIIKYYVSIPDALNDLLGNYYDGILLGYIPAKSFSLDLYSGKIKIATPPLNDAGLRLLTLYEMEPELQKAFNRGLEKMRGNGTYEKLLKKWSLD